MREGFVASFREKPYIEFGDPHSYMSAPSHVTQARHARSLTIEDETLGIEH
jgi:hypothetical protein